VLNVSDDDKPLKLDYETKPVHRREAFFTAEGVEALAGMLVVLAVLLPAVAILDTKDRPWVVLILFVVAYFLDYSVCRIVRSWCQRRFPTDRIEESMLTRRQNFRREIVRVVSLIASLGLIYLVFRRR
jgi:hypothetical protein